MTIEQIKTDYNYLCGLEIPEMEVNLYLHYAGSKIKYWMYWQRQIVFEGNDYKPSILHDYDSIESVTSLLSFLTLKQGDTDSDYFKDYGTLQWKWVDSLECDQLRSLLSDFTSGEPDENECNYKEVKEFYDESFTFFNQHYVS